MRAHKIFKAAVIAGAIASSASAVATTVTLSDFAGTWSNATGGVNVSYSASGTAAPQVRWGSTSGSQSGYGLQLATTPIINDVVPPAATGWFLVADFTHYNFPISSGTGISGVDLTLNFNLTIGGAGPVAYDYIFHFDHWETPNSATPCADGGPNGVGVNISGCADRVMAAGFNQRDIFLIDGTWYTFDLLGWLPPGGSEIQEAYWTKEGLANSAGLYGHIRVARDEEIPVVPEPGSLALLGLGLLGLGLTRRKAA